MIAAAWAAFKGSKIGMWLVFAAAVVWGLLVLVGRLMSAGAAKEQAAQAARNEEVRRQADEVRNDVDAAGDPELDRLRDKWTRQ